MGNRGRSVRARTYHNVYDLPLDTVMLSSVGWTFLSAFFILNKLKCCQNPEPKVLPKS